MRPQKLFRRQIIGNEFDLIANKPQNIIDLQPVQIQTTTLYKLEQDTFQFTSKQHSNLKLLYEKLQQKYSIQSHQVVQLQNDMEKVQKETVPIKQYLNLEKELFEHQSHAKNLQTKLYELQQENNHLIQSQADQILKQQLKQAISQLQQTQFKADQQQQKSEQNRLDLQNKLCDLEKTHYNVKFSLENEVYQLKEQIQSQCKQFQNDTSEQRLKLQEQEDKCLEMKQGYIQLQIQLNQITYLQEQLVEQKQLTKKFEDELYRVSRQYEQQIQLLQSFKPEKQNSRFLYIQPYVLQFNEDVTDLKQEIKQIKKQLQFSFNLNTMLENVSNLAHSVYSKNRSNSPEVYKKEPIKVDLQSKIAEISILKNLNEELKEDYHTVMKEKIKFEIEAKKYQKIVERLEQDQIYSKFEDLERDFDMQSSQLLELERSKIIDQEKIEILMKKSRKNDK